MKRQAPIESQANYLKFCLNSEEGCDSLIGSVSCCAHNSHRVRHYNCSDLITLCLTNECVNFWINTIGATNIFTRTLFNMVCLVDM